jgi:hypothetical protein
MLGEPHLLEVLVEYCRYFNARAFDGSRWKVAL